MNRRKAIEVLAAGVALAGPVHLRVVKGTTGQTLGPVAARPLDPMFIWQWRMAQRNRPPVTTATSRVAPVDEAGSPLEIRGQLFRVDGLTPAVGAIVFAYHTDRTGVYAAPGASRRQPWRLHGWARTNDEGRFTFLTVRPAPYPARNESAHVHITADGPGITGQVVESLRFADDALNTRQQVALSSALGRFAPIRPVVGGVCDLALRLTGEWPL